MVIKHIGVTKKTLKILTSEFQPQRILLNWSRTTGRLVWEGHQGNTMRVIPANLRSNTQLTVSNLSHFKFILSCFHSPNKLFTVHWALLAQDYSSSKEICLPSEHLQSLPNAIFGLKTALYLLARGLDSHQSKKLRRKYTSLLVASLS